MNLRIKKKKGLVKTRRKFDCPGCHNFTNQKIVKSTQKGWEWQDIYVCLDCGFRMDSSWHQYSCDKCGADTEENSYDCKLKECDREEELKKKIDIGDLFFNPCHDCPNYELTSGTHIGTTDKGYNYGASMEYGSCYDWTEIHKCWNCGNIYEFDNSNC